MDVFLQTERLILRRFTEDDVDLLVELDSDPEVMHFISNGTPTPRAEIESDFLPAFLSYYDRFEGYGFWAAVLKSTVLKSTVLKPTVEKATGAFIGWFHLRAAPQAPADEPELGYRLRRSAWGHGYATEGSRALIDKAFTDLGTRRVVAETMTVHTASREVMRRCGMTLVRTFHQPWPYPIPGDEHGDVEYAITRAEWAARTAQG